MAARSKLSLASRCRPKARLWLDIALALAALALVAGWFLPVMTVETMVLLADEISILDSCWLLLDSGHWFLFAVVFVFSIVFPAVKLIAAALLWSRADVNGRHFHRWLRIVESLGKWSMLDVFVMALVVVAVQASFVAEVALHPGIYLFTGAILLSIFTVGRIARLAEDLVPQAPEKAA